MFSFAFTICSSFFSSLLFCYLNMNIINIRKDWRRKWQPSPVFLPGKFHGQRSLVGSSLWGHKRVRHDWVTSNSSVCKAGSMVSVQTYDVCWLDLTPASFDLTLKIALRTWCVCASSVAHSCLPLWDPWTVANQAPLSLGFPREGYWSGLPFPALGNPPDPGIESHLLCFRHHRQALYHPPPGAVPWELGHVFSFLVWKWG